MFRPGGQPSRGARIGIDVGGTFTDFVLAVPGRAAATHHKEPSTPGDPSAAIATGLSAVIAQAGISPEDVASITHGTTLGLNAIIQRRGARIALAVTSGYRDLLEIGRSRMPSSFDLHAAKEEALVPRDRIVEIDARLAPDGTPTRIPPDGELDRVAAALQATGADAVAVVVLHGYTNPAFEAGTAAALGERLPHLPVTSSAAVWPEIREYERTLVACLNTYVQPLLRGYLERLAGHLAALGVTAPVAIAASNGGSLSLASASERPVETLLSGPACGVMAAARLARAGGIERVVTLDMGGTSSDLAVSISGQPELTTRTTIGGLPLILPVVAVSAIGAGGGSIVSVDDHGVLKVGPDSAGADPGPVAYGRGGTRPTVTDCYVLTGIIDPDGFLGGRMRLDADAAARALAVVAAQRPADPQPSTGPAASPTDSASPSDPDRELAAAQRVAADALRVATAGMATELQKTLAQRGLDPAGFTLVPYGGAGPTQAAALAEEAGIGRIIIPPTAATFCALGAAGADLRRDFARSLRRRLDEASAAQLRAVLADLTADAHTWLAEQKGLAGEPRLLAAADLRYAGQAHELAVPLEHDADGDRQALTAAAVTEAFHREHERTYGFRDDTAPVELGTVRLAIIGPTGDVPSARLPVGDGTPPPGHGQRRVLLASDWHTARVYARDRLRAGDRLDGPAIVEQDDTTVLVPDGWSATADPAGNLDLRSLRGEAGEPAVWAARRAPSGGPEVGRA